MKEHLSFTKILNIFKKAVEETLKRPSLVRFLVVLVIFELMSILLILEIPLESKLRLLLFVLLFISTILFALLAAIHDYIKLLRVRINYSSLTEEALKNVIREKVLYEMEQKKLLGERTIYLLNLIQLIDGIFLDDRELRELFRRFQEAYTNCTIDYDSIGVQNKLAKVCGIVLYSFRHEALNELIESIHHLRPSTTI